MATSLKRSKGTPSSTQIGTFSYWIRRSKIGVGMNVYSNTVENDNNRGYIQFESDDAWRMVDNDASGDHIVLKTTRKFRDVSSWYHIVVRVDTTQSTNTDRVRVYVNGVQETSFSSTTYPNQNENLKIFEGGQTNREYINNIYGGSAGPSFYISHFHFADGQSYGPDTFGSTDPATGEWSIKASPTVTYGNQGFFMFKNDASLNDDSGNSNNWSADTGTIQKSEDNPSNVFCTWNPLARGDLTNNATLSNGNTYYSSDQSGYNIRAGTIGASKGKFYWEGKFVSHNPQTSPGMPLGIIADNVPIGTNIAGGQAPYYYSYTYDGSNGSVVYNSTGTNYGTTILDTIGQIGMVALDLDNNKVYFGVNGTWTNSGDPANGTNGYSIIDPADTPLGFYLPATSDRSSIREYVYAWNFGNGYFGTTAVSSAGTNASGIGIFEYDVPTGYTALSTKGLNE